MNRLWIGADRDHLCLWIERGEDVQTITHRTVVGERNDHRLVVEFLVEHNVAWADITDVVLLQPPHSKTTVRVNASLLAASAWFHDRSIVIINVDSLDTVDIKALASKATTVSAFDPQTLGEIA